MSFVDCRKCRHGLEQGANFCDRCGTAIGDLDALSSLKTAMCTHCVRPLKGAKQYCGVCGHRAGKKDKKKGQTEGWFTRLLNKPAVQITIACVLLFSAAPTIYFTWKRAQEAMGREEDIQSNMRRVRTLLVDADSSSRPMLPSSLAVDNQGNVYVAEDKGHRVLRIDNKGRRSIFAGTGGAGFSGDGGPATQAQLDSPMGLALDSFGRLLIADTYNHRIRRVDADGSIKTISGSGPVGIGQGQYGGDGVLAIDARLNEPTAVAVDSSGRIYILDTGNRAIRILDRGGGSIRSFPKRRPRRRRSQGPRAPVPALAQTR